MRLVSGPKGYASNCHGASLGADYWIEPGVMKSLVRDFFTPTDSFEKGNLVIFRSGRDYVHSGTIDRAGETLRQSIWVGDDGGHIPPVRAEVGLTADYYNAKPVMFRRK
jgi:hypothetical protein